MWTATLQDGRIASSVNSRWSDIKDQVVGLSYDHKGIIHFLPSGQKNYFFFNSASVNMGGGKVTVDSRVIGCTLSNNTTIMMRFHEGSGNVVIETKMEI